MARKTIRVREFVRDVRSGEQPESLIEKYHLTELGLRHVFGRLIDQGLMTRAEVDGCLRSAPPAEASWVCPACGRPQPAVCDVCPVCGVIVAKFVPRQRITFANVQEEQVAKSLLEMLSFARHNLNSLAQNRFLWVICLSSILPLVVTTAPVDGQIMLFCGLVGMIWAIFFKKLVVRDSGGWALPISAMGFTGFTGVGFLLAAYFMLPASYMRLANSVDLTASLSGFVLQVGLCEELCKIAPALLYLLWKKARQEIIGPRRVVVLAVFSAIGFSATENVGYAYKVVAYASECAEKVGQEALATSVKGAMLNYMLRALSLVFFHAVLSGIFGCFLAIAAYARKLWLPLFILGLALSAGLHGLYDWMVSQNMVAAATIVGLSFILFYMLAARPWTPVDDVTGQGSVAVHGAERGQRL